MIPFHDLMQYTYIAQLEKRVATLEALVAALLEREQK
jgi:hypothetical protein